MYSLPLRRAVLLLAAAAALSCGRGDPLRVPLDGVVKAVEDRDAERMARFLTADYKDQEGWSRADVEGFVKRYVLAYESLDIAVSKLTLEKGEGVGRAQFRAELSGKPKDLPGLQGLFPSSSKYDFLVMLAEEKDGWKISSARWTQVP